MEEEYQGGERGGARKEGQRIEEGGGRKEGWRREEEGGRREKKKKSTYVQVLLLLGIPSLHPLHLQPVFFYLRAQRVHLLPH
jgi:hypothetical protein